MEIPKEEIIKYVQECCMSEMYDIFDICRERHNNQMFKNK